MFHLTFETPQTTMRQRGAHAMAYRRTSTYRRRQAAKRLQRFRLAVWALWLVAILGALLLVAHDHRRADVTPCTTDSDCAARFGGDGSPTPVR